MPQISPDDLELQRDSIRGSLNEINNDIAMEMRDAGSRPVRRRAVTSPQHLPSSGNSKSRTCSAPHRDAARKEDKRMRKLLVASVVLGLAPPALAGDSAKLVGVWKMTSWTRHEVATGKDTKLFGEQPGGYLIYTKGGHFMWTGFKDQRPKPAAAEPTDTERLALFKTMYAYDGTYKVEGGKIIDSVEVAWNEGWVGTKFTIDKYDVSDKTLTMVSAPFKSTIDGAEMIVTTNYERVE